MNVVQYLDDHPEVFTSEEPIKKVWNSVFQQGSAHFFRQGKDKLFEDIRPNEDELIKKYRKKIVRYITSEGPNQFLSHSCKIFQESSLSLSKDIDEALNEWLSGEPFYDRGQWMGLDEWVKKCVYHRALFDPNGVVIAFPRSRNDWNVAPAASISDGGNPRNERVLIEPIILHSSELIEHEHFFAWKGGQMKVDKAHYDFYFIADANFYYVRVPYKDAEGVIKYRIDEWYEHGIGEVPLNKLPGRVAETESGDKYNESYLRAAYEHWDEFDVTFSDGQGLKTLHANPKVVIRSLPCTNPRCKSGYVISEIDKDDHGRPVKTPCGTCKTKGYLLDPGPHGVLLAPPGGDFNKESLKDFYSYIQPPLEGIKFIYETAWTHLQKGNQAIGLDVLLNASESGEAMKQRLQLLKVTLMDIMQDLYGGTVTRFLSHVTKLLNKDDEDIKVSFQIPTELHIEPIEVLQKEVQEADISDRTDAKMRLYAQKYKGNDVLIRAKKWALHYSPLLNLTDEELQVRLLNGVYTNDDIRKRDYAEWVFRQLMAEEGFMNWTKERAMKEADDLLVKEGILGVSDVLLNIDDPDTIDPEQVGNKLLETVGGVQGIISVNQAVSRGEMTESAAEGILIEVYGFSREVANRLIDAPTIKQEA